MIRLSRLLSLFLCALPAAAHTFALETVASTANVNYDHTRAAIDSQGNIGLCYQSTTAGDLYYTYYNGAVWSSEVVESAGTVGAHCAIAFDAADAPHIIYYDVTNNRLRHATKDAGWVLRTVDAVQSDVWFEHRLSLAISAQGTIGAAYYDRTNSALRYAAFAGGNWTAATVVSAGDVGKYPALAYDSAGRPAIVYMQYTNASSSATMWIAHDGAAWGVPSTLDATEKSGAWNAL